MNLKSFMLKLKKYKIWFWDNYEPRTLEEIVVGSERFNNEQKL